MSNPTKTKTVKVEMRAGVEYNVSDAYSLLKEFSYEYEYVVTSENRNQFLDQLKAVEALAKGLADEIKNNN